MSSNPKLGYHNSIFCKHDATLMSWALRDLKLLEVSRGLGFTKGMDSLDKDVAETSFLQYVTFCEQGQQKRWQSRFPPTEAKS